MPGNRRENHLTLGNLHDSNQAVYHKALSSCLLMGMLAFAATVIVWMILRNTLASAQEQGRKRTGILQALGVTTAQMYRGQAFQALRDWLIAMVGAHGVLALAVLISGWMQRMGQGFSLMALLWKGGLPCGERKEYSILHVLPYRRRGGPMCPPVADITNSP